MEYLAGPYLAAALLLGAAGFPKIIDPTATVRAAREGGIPVGAAAIRLFGVVEVLVAGVALTVGGLVPALLVAASYAGFAGFVARALGRGMESCGCFGGDDSPPSVLHVVLNVAMAGVAIAVALTAAPSSLLAVIDDAGATTALLVAAIAAIDARLVYLVLARYPHRIGVPAVVTVGR